MKMEHIFSLDEDWRSYWHNGEWDIMAHEIVKKNDVVILFSTSIFPFL